MLPLTTANLLAPAIVGSALENMDIERLIREVGMAVAERVHGNNESVDDVAKELHEKLLLRNESTKKVVIENIYRDIPEAQQNIQVWINSPNIATARPQLKKVSQLLICARPISDLSFPYRSKALASRTNIYQPNISQRVPCQHRLPLFRQ